MKARVDAILRPEQAEYLERLTPENTGLLAEMEEYAAEHRVPIADREVARFLEITARSIAARRVLEIGMAIGYSVVHLARALPRDGLVVTIEPSGEMIERSEDYLRRASLRERVRIERGRALEVLPRIGETFDLVFLDAGAARVQPTLRAPPTTPLGRPPARRRPRLRGETELTGLIIQPEDRTLIRCQVSGAFINLKCRAAET